jgi:hypothetical protein
LIRIVLGRKYLIGQLQHAFKVGFSHGVKLGIVLKLYQRIFHCLRESLAAKIKSYNDKKANVCLLCKAFRVIMY